MFEPLKYMSDNASNFDNHSYFILLIYVNICKTIGVTKEPPYHNNEKKKKQKQKKKKNSLECIGVGRFRILGGGGGGELTGMHRRRKV